MLNDKYKNIEKRLEYLEYKINYNVESEIIKKNDLDFIEKKLNPDNKNIKYNLIYKCDENNDNPKAFHEKCDGKKNVLVFIETTKKVCFGGYTSVGFDSKSNLLYDDKAFLFSLDKRKIYNIKKNNKAIYCHANYGPCFLGTISTNIFNIYIEKDNFLKNKYHTAESEDNYYEINNDYELNNSESDFYIKKLEVFQVIFC